MSIADIEAAESAEQTAEHIEKAMRMGYDRFETRHRRKDGSEVPVEISSQFSSARGGVFVVFIRDLTERRKTAQDLRILGRAIEASPASVVVTDRDGTIDYVNPSFTQVTGYSPAEAIGSNPRILKSGTRSEEFYRDLWETITSGGEWHGEFLNRKKNGQLYWESAAIAPIKDARDQITHYIAVKEDISGIKHASRELEELARLRDDLTHMIIHDMRSPLAAILGGRGVDARHGQV